MTALLAGATGLIGREVARHWTGPGPIHLLVRREMPAAQPLHRVHVVDYAALPPLPQADLAFCCLGTTIQQAGSQEAFRAVDHSAVLAFARAAQRAGVKQLAVVSALGANPKSGTFYNRVKGEMEAELQTLGLRQLVIARPSLLAGDRAALGQPPRAAERAALLLSAPFSAFIPKGLRPIEARTVARGMVAALRQPHGGVRIVESAGLQDLGAA
jgi:uncharacterized protein YbjT (DUF2867 family)